MTKKNKNLSSASAGVKQSTLFLTPSAYERLDIATLEISLWDAACAIREATDAPKFKNFILPLIFYKHLSDVFDDEFAEHIALYDDEQVACEVIGADRADALHTGRRLIVRFYIPLAYTWANIRNHPADGCLGEFVTMTMRKVARLNPDLQGVLDVKNYNNTERGQHL